MSEVNIRYDGSSIATMDASGTKTLLTAGKYCPASFQVEYNRPTIPDLPTDVPVFTINRSADWSEYISPTTCNMTYAEVQAWVNQNYPSVQACAQVIHFDGTNYTIYPAVFSEASSSDLVFTVLEAPAEPILDLHYHSDPTLTHVITHTRPSQYYVDHRELTSNSLYTINKYVNQISVSTEYIVGLEKDANDNYYFTDTFADITAAHTSGQELLVATNELTDVYVESVRYEESSDPDTHPEDAFFWVTIIEVSSNMISVPSPDGTMNVENMRHAHHDIILHYDGTVEDTPGSVFYMVDGLAFGTEAQPSDVPDGLLFINSDGIQIGTAT